MRLCRFDRYRYGIVKGDTVHDVTPLVERVVPRVDEGFRGDPVIAHLDALRAGSADLSEFVARPVSEVKLLSPVARPSKLVAAPVNYHAHIAEMRAQASPTNPPRTPNIGEAGMFLKANSALVGPSEGVAIRFPDRRNDHELELVVVIGRAGSDIPAERALDHVAGYTLGLDMTVRGPEDRSFRKSVDSYAVLGPWMVTADEIPDPGQVGFTLRVNGELRHDANTSDLIWGIPRLIEYASSFYTLHPGDVIYTGSPAGVGPVKPGDVLLGECAAIGRMEVKVRAHVK
jgi:2,4-diketo-3-deoxy-L-fuconate hydrolase